MLNQRSIDRLRGVKICLIDCLIEASKDSPYEFQIPPFGGCRTAEEQHGLFLKKVSKCDGYDKKSAHQTGMAYDIYLVLEPGKASWDKAKLKEVQYHIKKIAVEKFKLNLSLGCDWKWKDYPHGEIK